MKALMIKRDFQIDFISRKNQKFDHGFVYIIPDSTTYMINHLMSQQKIKRNKYYDVVDLEKLIPRFDDREDNTNITPVIIRSGGIGDLVVISALTYYLRDRARQSNIICDIRYHELFKYFAYPPQFLYDHFEPFIRINGNFHNLRSITLEWWTKGPHLKDNWFESMFKKINAQFRHEYGRPQLYYNNSDKKNVIVIVNRASSYMRSMPLKNIQLAVDLSNYRGLSMLVFDKNLTNEDRENVLFDTIILQDKNLSEYIGVIKMAKLVISVDTSAVHLAEGFGIPGIGIYSAFSPESRTKYYKYMNGIFIRNFCEKSPCFLHDQKINDQCPEMNEMEYNAPCLDYMSNLVIKQLTEALNEILL